MSKSTIVEPGYIVGVTPCGHTFCDDCTEVTTPHLQDLIAMLTAAKAKFRHWRIRERTCRVHDRDIPFVGTCLTLGSDKDGDTYTQFLFDADGACVEAKLFNGDGEEV